MFQGIIKPLIPEGAKSPASLRQFADAMRKKDPVAANAFERAQQSFDRLDQILRSTPEQADEIVISDPDGNVIGWIGSRDGYWGAWFGQIYAGGSGPIDSNLYIDNAGVLNIRDAYISLTSGTKSIILDPTYPDFQFNDAGSKFEISGTGGGTHQITLAIVDDSDPNLYTAYLSSQGILTLKGYTHQAMIGITNYGSDPVVFMSRAGGTAAAPTAPGNGDILGGLDFSTYDAGISSFVKANAIMSRKTAAGSAISFEDDLAIPSVVIDPTAQTMVVNDGALTANYKFDVKGDALFRDDLDVTGVVTLNDASLTAVRPLKIDTNNVVVTGLIDVNDANDVAATGFATGDYAQWDGTKFVPVTLATMATDLATPLASSFAAAGALPGGGHTLTLAKITPGGTDGAIQFNADGQVIAYVDPT